MKGSPQELPPSLSLRGAVSSEGGCQRVWSRRGGSARGGAGEGCDTGLARVCQVCIPLPHGLLWTRPCCYQEDGQKKPFLQEPLNEAIRGGCYYYDAHFTDEETKVRKG